MSELSSSTSTNVSNREEIDYRQQSIELTQQLSFKDIIIRGKDATIQTIQQLNQSLQQNLLSRNRFIEVLQTKYNELRNLFTDGQFNLFLSWVEDLGSVSETVALIESLRNQLDEARIQRDEAIVARDLNAQDAAELGFLADARADQIAILETAHTEEVNGLNERNQKLQEEIEDLSLRIVDLNEDIYENWDEMEDQQDYINDLEHQVHVINPPNALDAHHPEESGE